MSNPQFVLVVEAGLRKNSYGADIRYSAAMGRDEVAALVDEVTAGKRTELFDPRPGTLLLRISDTEFIAVHPNRLQPDDLTRITAAELLHTF
jgi:hypothetical protein